MKIIIDWICPDCGERFPGNHPMLDMLIEIHGVSCKSKPTLRDKIEELHDDSDEFLYPWMYHYNEGVNDALDSITHILKEEGII